MIRVLKMGRVYSYLRFSDPKQAAGSSVQRQIDYARRWADERGFGLDESLSLRDEGLSAYHQRHVTQGALGVFLRAVEDGRIEPGSVLIVEGLDRLSRAEPIQAQAQLAQIINAGITVVTASDGREYNREGLKAQPMDLVYSLLVMIRAHEESDTKSKRVKAAIRRQCEGWLAGTWRGVIRNGKDPQWVRWNGSAWEIVEERAAALRFAISQFLAGRGAVNIVREMAERGMSMTDTGRLGSAHLYKTLKRRLLIGERDVSVGGETYHLPGYYPAILSQEEFDALQVAVNRRQGKRGVGEIPSILSGMGLLFCGYCGSAIVSQNLMGRKRRPDGSPWPGYRRLICTGLARGAGCHVPGSIQAGAIERELMIYCADRMRMASLTEGGDQGAALRAEIARQHQARGMAEKQIDRLTRALAEDDGATPIAMLRKLRELESTVEAASIAIETAERELANLRPVASDDLSERWLALIDGVEKLDIDSRLQARELTRASFSRITLWHAGDPAGADDGQVIDMEITARGGGSVRLRIDKRMGVVID